VLQRDTSNNKHTRYQHFFIAANVKQYRPTNLNIPIRTNGLKRFKAYNGHL
jgi:hypothetical protein